MLSYLANVNSIVFVHGLRGGRESTWTKEGVVWPKEILLKDVVKSRILSFGYNSGVVHSNTAEVT
jgi:protein SERAC1